MNKPWAKGITAVQFVTDLGDTPAAVDRYSGIIYLNGRMWPTLTKDQKFFVLLHEWAHIQLQSTDEKAVDKLAFEEYSRRGYSLKQSVNALTRLLNFSDREHYERAYLQLQRAIQYDKEHNNNQHWNG
jgi:hypothetical protein